MPPTLASRHSSLCVTRGPSSTRLTICHAPYPNHTHKVSVRSHLARTSSKIRTNSLPKDPCETDLLHIYRKRVSAFRTWLSGKRVAYAIAAVCTSPSCALRLRTRGVTSPGASAARGRDRVCRGPRPHKSSPGGRTAAQRAHRNVFHAHRLASSSSRVVRAPRAGGHTASIEGFSPCARLYDGTGHPHREAGVPGAFDEGPASAVPDGASRAWRGSRCDRAPSGPARPCGYARPPESPRRTRRRGRTPGTAPGRACAAARSPRTSRRRPSACW